MEKLVKVVVAEVLVAVPLNVASLCICFAYYIFGTTDQISILQMFLLLGFVLMSALFLTTVGSMVWIIMGQRRTQRVRWWGAQWLVKFNGNSINNESEAEWGVRMAMRGFAVPVGWWLLLMSMTFQSYAVVFVPSLDLRLLGRV